MAEELATSLGGEVQMIDRSVLTVNEVAFQPLKRPLCEADELGELSHLHYLNCTSVGLVVIAL